MDNLTRLQIRQRLHRQVQNAKRNIFFKTGERIGRVKINYDEIIERLDAPFGNLKDFEIDHIIPLSYLNTGSKEQFAQAFHPSNFQWLLKSENRKKSAHKNSEKEIEVFNAYKKDLNLQEAKQ